MSELWTELSEDLEQSLVFKCRYAAEVEMNSFNFSYATY